LPTEIGVNHHFFKLGGHSLKATTLVSRIKKELNTNIPLIEIFNRPTIQQQANFIREHEEKSNPIQDPHLVLLKEEKGSCNHLFLIHDGSGDVDAYIEFCNSLNSGYNCWGIKAYGFKNFSPKNITIEELAGKYIQMIRQVKASQPYRIAGWSLGGIIALEMVLQMEQINQKVDFLALIDAFLPNRELSRPLDEFTLESELNWIKNYLPGDLYERVRAASQPEHLWQLITEHLETGNMGAEVLKGLLIKFGGEGIAGSNHLSIGESIRYLNILRSFARARALYIPKGKINTSIYFFKASDNAKTYSHFPGSSISMDTTPPTKMKENLYRQMSTAYRFLLPRSKTSTSNLPGSESFSTPLPGDIQTTFYEIQGDHYSILKPPQVNDLVNIFQQIMKR
jgi:thioesterase domain-containing protein/acyl carrier protein